MTALALGDAERALLARVRFLQQWMPELDWAHDPDALLMAAAEAVCAGRRSLAELRDADVLGALRGFLTHRQRDALAREAPPRLTLPSGRGAALTYEPDRPPWFAARIQDVFGLRATPRLAAGRVPVVIHLLSPAQRPMQVTDDLESFWRTVYPQVRKELRGRYPKHAWPEDPLGTKR
jgi:ATP-dependent helicase HrpB